MSSHSGLERISPVIFDSLLEWDRVEKKRLQMALDLFRGGDIGALKVVEQHGEGGRFIAVKVTILVHSKVTGSDWYSVQGTFKHDNLWPCADLTCSCSERTPRKLCSHSLCLLLAVSLGQYLKGIVPDASWCKPVTAHLPQQNASKVLMERPELKELLWKTKEELWQVVTGAIDVRALPSAVQRYQLGWRPAISPARGLSRGRAARPITSTSFLVASGAQPFRSRGQYRGVGRPIQRETNPPPENETTLVASLSSTPFSAPPPPEDDSSALPPQEGDHPDLTSAPVERDPMSDRKRSSRSTQLSEAVVPAAVDPFAPRANRLRPRLV